MNNHSFSEQIIPNRILIFYLIIAIIAAFLAPMMAVRWFQVPFIGGFIDPTMRIIPVVEIIEQPDWYLQRQQSNSNLRLVEIDNQPVASSEQLKDILETQRVGAVLALTLADTSDQLETQTVRLSSFSALNQIIYFWLPYTAGLACLLLAGWLLSDPRKQPLTIAYSATSISLALILMTSFDCLTSHQLSPLLLLGIAMVAGALVQIILLYPGQLDPIRRNPWLSFLAYPLNLILAGLAILQLNQANSHTTFPKSLMVMLISTGVSLLTFLIVFSSNRRKTNSPLLKKQAEMLLQAAMLSFLPIYLFMTVRLINRTALAFNPLLLTFFLILPITFTLQNKRFVLAQSARHFAKGLLTVGFGLLFGFGYFLLVFFLNMVLPKPLQSDNPLIVGILIFLTVLFFEPLRLRINKYLHLEDDEQDANKMRAALTYTEQLIDTDSHLVAIMTLQEALLSLLHPVNIQVYLYSQKKSGFYVVETPLTPTADTIDSFASDDRFVATLKESRSTLYPGESETPLIEPDYSLLSNPIPNSVVHVPILGSHALLGWISLGALADGEPYAMEDIRLIESLAGQFALMYERVETAQNIQARLYEMEILNQISIDINQITDLDTLLLSITKRIEAITGINQLSLVTNREEQEAFQRVFSYRENKVLINTTSPEALTTPFLEHEAIVHKEIMLTCDEGCWLVIPLTKKDAVLGALSLGHSQDKQIFEQTELQLLDSIAHLVTGAILKVQLLQTAQQQAQRLLLLNEISEQLTTTLNTEDLFHYIPAGSAKLVDVRSVMLMTVDQSGDTLTCVSGIGPGISNRIGSKFSRDRGLLGEAFTSREPVINNQPDPKDPLLSISAIEGIGAVNNLLILPLTAQNHVAGLLIFINKQNGQNFTEDDVSTLEGFTNQAAIAMSNVLLYEQTDRALEQRIEELSLMQSIDRKLHSSQDIAQAIHITLESALTKTSAICGTMGLVDTYTHQVEDLWQWMSEQDQPLSLDMMDLDDFIWFSEDSTSPYQIIDSSESELVDLLTLPPACQTHILLQSKLEESIYSMLILHFRSLEDLTQDDIQFLVRLNDHAIIALRNAILYEDLQNAINAKNEFIHYISHELKNPLTAIKGHADILAKGMAGEVSEEQADFLRTISHNVRRMNTFITDLADQSQLESRSIRLVFSSESVSEVIDEVLLSFAQQIREKSLRVVREADGSTPNVWCDRLRLIQILSNLISNAIKYTPPGGQITIGAEYAINHWDQEGAAEVIHFSIKDNGYGVLPEDQPHLFEKFFRGTNNTILKVPGTGLGLIISKSLTELMGGKMWFESEPGEGSVFHFTLPI